MKETGLTGKRRSTTIAANPDDGKSQRKRRRSNMLVADQQVTFLIHLWAFINMLLVKYGTEPYSGVLKMWNEVTGTCRMKVTNRRNGQKYSVPFLVVEGDRVSILSYRTRLPMKQTNHRGKEKL